ncbi:hypothetical protein [Proteus mirabilis]|uniref:hypothetical protein n=1 Tax=Proteus mirabilis TaxID=584 RepID=UPI0034D54E46
MTHLTEEERRKRRERAMNENSGFMENSVATDSILQEDGLVSDSIDSHYHSTSSGSSDGFSDM